MGSPMRMVEITEKGLDACRALVKRYLKFDSVIIAVIAIDTSFFPGIFALRRPRFCA